MKIEPARLERLESLWGVQIPNRLADLDFTPPPNLEQAQASPHEK